VSGSDTILIGNRQISKRTLVIIAAIFAILGAYLVFRSFAATARLGPVAVSCPAGVTQPDFPSRLKTGGTNGRQLVDEKGCVMPKLKGFNIHAAPASDANFVWSNDHFADISANGGHVLRTVVQWNAFEAQQGVISPTNLATLDKHIARAQRNGIYVILDLHLNVGAIPAWATDGSYSQGEETTYYAKNGQNITQTLAQRYSVARTADGITIDPRTVLGFNLNEPPQESTIINSTNSIPTFEAQQRQMIKWFRSGGAPNWIGFVTLAYANQKPQLAAPKISANPDAYDNIGEGIPGGNVVFDAHDYLVYNDSTDPNTDSRWDHGVLHDTRSAPGAHWLSILDPHNFPSDPALADRAKSQMKAFLKPFDTYATASQMPLMIGEFGWNGDRTGGTGKSGYYIAKREAMNSVNSAIEIHWIYATSYNQDQWSAKSGVITTTNPKGWDLDVLAWLKDANTLSNPITAPVDTVKPTLSWTKPAEGATVSGYMFEAGNSGASGPCEISAADDVGIAKVRFYADTTFLNEELGAPYNCKLDTTQFGNGSHVLKAEVYDAANNMTSATRTVNVQNGSAPISIDGEWKLLWEDNFDGTTLNTDPNCTINPKCAYSWSKYSGPGHGGNGLRQPAAISVSNGELVITAKNIDSDGNGTLDKVSSGGMSNRTNTKYGRFEARVRTELDPSGILSGVILTWPQTNKWPDEGENDFYETGTDPDTVTPRNPFSSFIHYPVPPPLPPKTPQAYVGHNADGTQYHDMRMDWTPDYIKIYRDGVLIKTINESDDHTINQGTVAAPNNITYTDNIPDFSHHMTVQLDATKPTLLSGEVKMYVDRVAHYELANSPPADTIAPVFASGAVLGATPASSTQINLSWPQATDNVGVSKYEVLRKGPTDASYQVIASPPLGSTNCPVSAANCTYQSTGLNASTAYNYQVRALDAANNSSAILSATATTQAPPVDNTPPTSFTLAHTVSSNQVNLSWTASTDPETGIKGYDVYRSANGGTPAKLNTTLLANTTRSLSDATVTIDTPYTYYIKAINNSTSATNSTDSNTINVTPSNPSLTLKLINADTDQPTTVPNPDSIMTNGMTIDLKNARNLNIDASNPAVAIESVQFNDNGQIKTESFPPYAIGEDAGTNSTDYFPWTPAVGDHTLTVKAFSADGAAGIELATTTVSFTVVDSGTNNPAGFELLYEDNFDGTILNTSAPNLAEKKSGWSPYGPYEGHAGNGIRTPTAISVDGIGNLVIEGKMVNGVIESGGMSNKTATKYGKFETRVKTEVDPTGTMSGVILTWPFDNSSNLLNGENDFYETGHPKGTRTPFYSFIHYPNALSGGEQSRFVHNSDGTQWHKVVMEWAPIPATNDEYINIKVYKDDGTLVSNNTIKESDDPTRENLPNIMHRLCIQLDAFQEVLPLTQPVKMTVDYARVYKYVGTSTPDTTPPTVSITNPTAADAPISGIMTATANATDNVAVTKVDFLIDGSYKFTDSDASNGHTYTIDTKTLSNGTHTIKAVAYDAAGNGPTTSSEVTFIISNPDTTAPSPPSNLSGITTQPTASTPSRVDLSWPAAADNSGGSGIKGYWVQRNGVTILCQGQTSGQPLSAATLTCTDSNVSTGSHSYVVRSVDNANLTSLTASPPYTTTINAPPDTAKPSAPANLAATASSQSQINLTWAASTDNVGVAGYNVYRGTSPEAITTKLNTSLVTTTSLGDNTGLTPSTTYYYQVEAVDAAGNKSDKSTSASAATLEADTAAPTVTITAPANGSTVSGHVSISARATDNRAVARTEIYIDGKFYAYSNSSSVTYSWNTNPKRWEGPHTITVKATDTSGNTAEQSVGVRR